MSELGKTFLKNQIKKHVNMPHLNKKPLARNGNFFKKTRPGMNYKWIGKTN